MFHFLHALSWYKCSWSVVPMEYGDPSTPAVPGLAAGPLSHCLPGKRASQGVVTTTEQKYTGTMTITLSSLISVCFVAVEVETRAEI